MCMISALTYHHGTVRDFTKCHKCLNCFTPIYLRENNINLLVLDSSGMPSSFRGSHGKIVYKLTATLARSWRLDRTVEMELNFISRSIPNLQTFLVSQRFELLRTYCDVARRTCHPHRCWVTHCSGIVCVCVLSV